MVCRSKEALRSSAQYTLLGPPNGTIRLQERITRSSCETFDPAVFDIYFLTERERLNWKCNQKSNKCH